MTSPEATAPFRPWEWVNGPSPVSGISAEQWRKLTQHLSSGADAAAATGGDYERYVPTALIRVPLEPAATSPFMDA